MKSPSALVRLCWSCMYKLHIQKQTEMYIDEETNRKKKNSFLYHKRVKEQTISETDGTFFRIEMKHKPFISNFRLWNQTNETSDVGINIRGVGTRRRSCHCCNHKENLKKKQKITQKTKSTAAAKGEMGINLRRGRSGGYITPMYES